MVWGMIVGERHEDDVSMTSAFDLPRTDHTFGVCQQNDLEQYFGMDRGRANHIVVVAHIKYRQVDMLVHQLADGVLQCPRYKLVLERNGEHHQLIFVAWFEFCYRFLCRIEPYRIELVIDFPLFRQSQRWALAAVGGRVDSPPKRKKPKARKMPKTRRVPTVSCTLCWAAS